MTPDKPTRLQFHWQHHLYHCKTLFVEQSPPLRSMAEAEEWIRSLGRYRDQCPPDHVAMVCDKGCNYFLRSRVRPSA